MRDTHSISNQDGQNEETAADEFSKLVSLTQLHLLQEYEKNAFIFTDLQTYELFLAFALKDKPQQPKLSKEIPPKEISQPQPSAALPLSKKAAPPLAAKNHSLKPPEKKAERPAQKEVSKSQEPVILEKIAERQADDFLDIRKSFSSLFPHQKVLDEMPDEKLLKQSSHPQVMVILDEDSPESHSFLINFAKAIQICLCPALAIPRKDSNCKSLFKTGGAKLVIGEEKTLAKMANEMQGLATFPLTSVEDFLQIPESKAALWKRACEEIKP